MPTQKTMKTGLGLSDYVLYTDGHVIMFQNRIRSLQPIPGISRCRGLVVSFIMSLMLALTNIICDTAFAGDVGFERTERAIQVRMGYWNDNFPIDSIFGKSLNRGEDDNVTAAIMLQTGWMMGEKHLFLELFDSIITNKTSHYRTDVVIARLLMRTSTQWGSYTIGGGILGNDNFGGEFLQNGYHSMTGIRKLELPYLRDTGIGPTIYTDMKTNLYTDGRKLLVAALSHSYRHTLLPSFGKAGLEFCFDTNPSGRKSRYGLRLYTGYLEHYDKKKYLREMFDDGILSGAMVSHGVPEKYHVSIFITFNQYGLKQPHYGLLFVWNWQEGMRFDLSDISFL